MTTKSIRYEDRGASADKADVHKAISHENQGLYPGAFCKVLPDTLTQSPEHCLIVHADGAGTKSLLAYVHYRETGDASVFRGLAQDSLIMNIDDIFCVGAQGPFLLSNTIGRNAKLIPGEVIAEIIAGYRDCIADLAKHDIDIVSAGGETADVGDIVRTLIVDSTLTVREKRANILTGEKIRPGLSIVGLYSGGQATYESQENSGLGSNGYTTLRHEILSSYYKEKYPEIYAPEIAALAYTGKFKFADSVPHSTLNIGQALLSPTRTYAPILKKILAECRDALAAIFHNTGGGQTKCLRFGQGIHYIKDNLFTRPPIFQLLVETGNIAPQEMYRSLNMGHRMEIICEPEIAATIVAISQSFNIPAQIIGHTEKAQSKNTLFVKSDLGEWRYEL